MPAPRIACHIHEMIIKLHVYLWLLRARGIIYTDIVLCVERTVCSVAVVTQAVTTFNAASVTMLSLQKQKKKCIFHVCKQIVVQGSTIYLERHIPVRLHLGLSVCTDLIVSRASQLFFSPCAVHRVSCSYIEGKLALTCHRMRGNAVMRWPLIAIFLGKPGHRKDMYS